MWKVCNIQNKFYYNKHILGSNLISLRVHPPYIFNDVVIMSLLLGKFFIWPPPLHTRLKNDVVFVRPLTHIFFKIFNFTHICMAPLRFQNFNKIASKIIKIKLYGCVLLLSLEKRYQNNIFIVSWCFQAPQSNILCFDVTK